LAQNSTYSCSAWMLLEVMGRNHWVFKEKAWTQTLSHLLEELLRFPPWGLQIMGFLYSIWSQNRFGTMLMLSCPISKSVVFSAKQNSTFHLVKRFPNRSESLPKKASEREWVQRVIVFKGFICICIAFIVVFPLR